jgi:hypothetical protein
MDKYAYRVSEYSGYELQECCRCVAVPLLHNNALICSENHCKGGFGDVLQLNVYLIICIGQVDFQAVLCLCNIHLNLILIWKQSHILDCVVILLTTIHDCSKFSHLLQDA